MIASGIWDGHILLADWLFLIAAVLFVVYAVLLNSRRPVTDGRAVTIPYVAFALVAIGLLVL